VSWKEKEKRENHNLFMKMFTYLERCDKSSIKDGSCRRALGTADELRRQQRDLKLLSTTAHLLGAKPAYSCSLPDVDKFIDGCKHR
jgi:hypothetical protein